MQSWQTFLEVTAQRGEVINTVFEKRLLELVGILERIARLFQAERIPYELIGGLAVFLYVEEVSPDLAALTRDVDLLINPKRLTPNHRSSSPCGIPLSPALTRCFMVTLGGISFISS